MNYFSQWPELEFIRQDETRVKASEALKGKEYVIFFIGAPWHKNYNEFIPTMKTFYETFHEKKKFEVILLTRGDTEEEILTDFFNPAFGQSTFSLPCSAEMLALRKRREVQMKALVAKQASRKDPQGSPPLPTSFSSSTPASSSAANAIAATTQEHGESDARQHSSTPSHRTPKDGGTAGGEVRQRRYGPGSTVDFSPLTPSTPIRTALPSTEGAVIQVPRQGKHGDYLLLDPAHSEMVGTPLLFFFRVFSYPGVVVCRVGVPVEAPPPLRKDVQPLPPPREKPYVPAVVRPPFERDQNGRRKYTPFIPDKRCQPDLCSMAGKWMIEKRDPNAESFPWDSLCASKTPFYFILFVLFLTILSCIFAVLLAKSPDLRAQVNTLFGYPLLAVSAPLAPA